jgi:hypothetical protein
MSRINKLLKRQIIIEQEIVSFNSCSIDDEQALEELYSESDIINSEIIRLLELIPPTVIIVKTGRE